MNHLFLLALTAGLAGTAHAQSPAKQSTTPQSLTKKLKEVVVPLHQELTAHLREQRKKADDRDRIEAAQTKKVAFDTYEKAKREVQANYVAEKKSRKAVFSQLQTTLKKAKRAAFSSKGTPHERLARIGSYLDVLAEQAETAEFKVIHKKIRAQQKWVQSTQSSLNK